MPAAPSPEQLRRQLRSHRAISLVSLGVAIASLLDLRPFAVRRVDAGPSLRSITVQELVVTDSAGTVRARLAGDVPDAVIDGRRMARGTGAGGLILYDATGQERGGYVTFDEPDGNAVLTLDTRRGQVAYFAADPEHGVALRLWTAGNQLELRADSGAARLSVVRAGEMLVQQPPFSAAETDDICSAMRTEITGLKEIPPFEVLLSACKQRMPDAACRRCLEYLRQRR